MWIERYLFTNDEEFKLALKRNTEQRDRKVVLVMKPHKFFKRD